MARLPDVPNVVRIGFSGTVNGSPWMCTLHGQYTGSAPDTASLNSACSSWATLWDNQFKSMYTTGTVLRTVEAWDLTSPAGAYGSTNVNLAGTIVGGGLANSTAQVISWKVNYRWRGGHPRSYLPPPSSAEVTNGHLWTSAHQATLLTQAQAFLTNFNAGTFGGLPYKLVCVKYRENKIDLAIPKVLLIADALVHSRVDTQRRRLGKEII